MPEPRAKQRGNTSKLLMVPAIAGFIGVLVGIAVGTTQTIDLIFGISVAREERRNAPFVRSFYLITQEAYAYAAIKGKKERFGLPIHPLIKVPYLQNKVFRQLAEFRSPAYEKRMREFAKAGGKNAFYRKTGEADPGGRVMLLRIELAKGTVIHDLEIKVIEYNKRLENLQEPNEFFRKYQPNGRPVKYKTYKLPDLIAGEAILVPLLLLYGMSPKKWEIGGPSYDSTSTYSVLPISLRYRTKINGEYITQKIKAGRDVPVQIDGNIYIRG